ncbi:MAG: (deoxy)nucleoside triphosphate pyrophosphohydrolase [Pseudobdellovibrio sp.]
MAIAQHTQVVALALFNPQREAYLIVKRGQDQSGAGKWEFPGGKIESHEGPKQALAREISEELSLVFFDGDFEYVASNTHRYPNKTVDLHLYKIISVQDDIKLIDHDELAWVKVQDLLKYDLAEADIPFVSYL